MHASQPPHPALSREGRGDWRRCWFTREIRNTRYQSLSEGEGLRGCPYSHPQYAGSREIGQVMQCPPPRPRPSSAPRTVITSIPALRSKVLVWVLRS